MVEIPFRQWLQDATGVLGWTPRTFWQASLVEYFAAITGWNEKQQGKTGKPPPVLRDEFEEMMREDRRRIARLERKKSDGQIRP